MAEEKDTNNTQEEQGKKDISEDSKVQGMPMPGSIADIMKQAHEEMHDEEAEKHNPEEVDRDLSALLEGGRIRRTIKIGKKVIKLRSLSKIDSMHANSVATLRDKNGKPQRDEKGIPIIDPDIMGKAYCAIGIEEISGIELPEMPLNVDEPESLERYLDAYQERSKYINKLPDAIVNSVLVELGKLHRYIDKISEVSVVENF